MTKYKAIKVNGKKIDKHRLVMENHLGRELKSSEVVHHIDGNKSNNRLSNLMLLKSRKEHNLIHIKQGDLKIKTGKNKKKLIKGKLKCSRCGELKDFSEYWRNKNNHLGYGGICKECHCKRRNGIA